MQKALFAGLLAATLLTGCDSKVTSTTDPEQQARFETLSDCFPNLYDKVEQLLDVVDAWRLASGSSIPNPTGLGSVTEQGDGSVTLSYSLGGTTLAMTIRFYSPTGVVQDLALSGFSSGGDLNDLVDIAADELRTNFPSGDSFLVGSWTLSGGGIAGSGAVTGVLGRDGSQDRLIEVRTTTDTPAGGPPPAASSTITDNGPPLCAITFSTDGLALDDAPQQSYPVGTIDFSLLRSPTTVTASVTFDGTSVAAITVSGVTGSFLFDIAQRELSYVP